jgi:hypothetical protein
MEAATEEHATLYEVRNEELEGSIEQLLCTFPSSTGSDLPLGAPEAEHHESSRGTAVDPPRHREPRSSPRSDGDISPNGFGLPCLHIIQVPLLCRGFNFFPLRP